MCAREANSIVIYANLLTAEISLQTYYQFIKLPTYVEPTEINQYIFTLIALCCLYRSISKSLFNPFTQYNIHIHRGWSQYTFRMMALIFTTSFISLTSYYSFQNKTKLTFPMEMYYKFMYKS